MHTNSRLLFTKYARPYFQPGMRVLEIGPGEFPSTYQSIVDDPTIDWHTLDMKDDPRLTYRSASEYCFPIPANAYDLIVSGQVIEHVRKIWVWIREVARVCKRNGFVITIAPVSWPYHEAPVDCWRVYPEGIKALYEEAQVEVLSVRCESLEAHKRRRDIPGMSAEWQGWKRRTAFGILGSLGFPIERAYDTIAVGRKLG